MKYRIILTQKVWNSSDEGSFELIDTLSDDPILDVYRKQIENRKQCSQFENRVKSFLPLSSHSFQPFPMNRKEAVASQVADARPFDTKWLSKILVLARYRQFVDSMVIDKAIVGTNASWGLFPHA